MNDPKTRGSFKVTDVMRLCAVALAVAAVAGCASGAKEPAPVSTGGSNYPGGSASAGQSIAEQACLREVAREANTRAVVLVESTPSPEGTEVIIGVGAQRALWRCIGYEDGTTTVVISMAEEGLL
jgi:hypothetical protein